MRTSGPGDVLSEAVDAADRAAARSGVVVREVDALEDLARVSALFERVWSSDPGASPAAPELLRALALAGNYVAAAFDGDELIGASAGFCEPPERRALHSHVAGVATSGAGRGVGHALKLHQRAWALARGIDTIAWTFDPLVRRNAHVNLVKLRATPTNYLPNFYGPMHDAINRGDESDRLHLRWDLAAAAVRAACDGDRPAAVPPARRWAPLVATAADAPVTASHPGALVCVGVPCDIESMRRSDPAAARAWRLAVRHALEAELAAGSRIVGFDRAHGYLIDRGDRAWH